VTVFTVPFSTILTFWILGFWIFCVLLFEWLTLWPNKGFLPHISHLRDMIFSIKLKQQQKNAGIIDIFNEKAIFLSKKN